MYLKLVLVIFLTVLFKIISRLGLKNDFSLEVLLLFLSSILVLYFIFLVKKLNKIQDTFSSYLSAVHLSMSTGKSFIKSLETALLYQKSDVSNFYKRIFHRISVLKSPESSFFFRKHDLFYKNLFKISNLNAYQIESVQQLKAQTLFENEIVEKERAIKIPFRVQTCLIFIIYLFLWLWHLKTRQRALNIEFLSLILFINGLVVSYLVSGIKTKI